MGMLIPGIALPFAAIVRPFLVPLCALVIVFAIREDAPPWFSHGTAHQNPKG